ncbi:MAG: DUF953 domain-containing protein [Planctomycetes bacterium]|nr:DUF953 domain-containing protein [Planctomycetota bacterium]
MPIARCATPAEAETALAAIVGTGGSALFLFFGSEDPQTGSSWCPDCVTADPVLRRACTTLRPDLVLHECPVGERSAWKNVPAHPYRIHPVWRVQRIPTLVLIEGGCERGRLIEADCGRPDSVAAFLAGKPQAAQPG